MNTCLAAIRVFQAEAALDEIAVHVSLTPRQEGSDYGDLAIRMLGDQLVHKL
jgi:hypothetical protein